MAGWLLLSGRSCESVFGGAGTHCSQTAEHSSSAGQPRGACRVASPRTSAPNHFIEHNFKKNHNLINTFYSVYFFAVQDCVVSDWGPWSDCDSQCGPGSQSRTRTIVTEPTRGGAFKPNSIKSRLLLSVERKPPIKGRVYREDKVGIGDDVISSPST